MPDPREPRPSVILASLPTGFRDDAGRLAETFDYVDHGLWNLARSIRLSRESNQSASITDPLLALGAGLAFKLIDPAVRGRRLSYR